MDTHIHHLFGRALARLNLVLYSLLIAVIGLQVLSRWLLGPWFGLFFTWTENLATYLLVFVVFIGAGLSSREHGHINITFVRDYFSNRVAFVIDRFLKVLTIAFLLLLLDGAVGMYNLNTGLQIGTLPDYPPFTSAWLYVAAGLGAVLMLIYTVRDLINPAQELSGQTEPEEDVA